ncbi:MAG: NAD(+) synthase [Kiritimatiellae bacterium]|nr:NAD(+) synthase [Kiritimatiellia bacterium]
MGNSEFGSLFNHPDFRRALRSGKVKPAPRLPPCLSLPFHGKPDRVFALQTAGLAARLEAIGCRQAVVGLSGGLDSALALLVVSAAFNRLGYDRSGIHVLTMPGFGTTSRTKGNAGLLAGGLGLRLETISIAAICRRHLKEIGHDGRTPDLVYENAQARMRTLVLMDRANQVGGIVVGTGDMSEIALGWCTYNGDHMSMFGVNAGVPKTVVREVCLWWAQETVAVNGARSIRAKAAQALRDIAATPISPELVKGQKTEDTVGPYELHDYFLAEYVGRNRGRAEVFAGAFKAFGGRYDAATIARWLDVFVHRLLTQAFKRNCAPDGVKIYRDIYFGPDDWHIPSDLAARVSL